MQVFLVCVMFKPIPKRDYTNHYLKLSNILIIIFKMPNKSYNNDAKYEIVLKKFPIKKA